MKKRFYFLLVLAIFLADQISKWWVIEQYIKPRVTDDRADPAAMPFISWLLNARERMGFFREEIWPFFNVVMVWNKGISFGLFNGHDGTGAIVLAVFAVAVMAVFTVWLIRTQSRLAALGIATIIGGALGNVVDRLRFGAVADFLDFHIGGWHWPAFNIGDSAICLGIAMLLIHSLFFDTKNKQAPTS